MTNQVHEFLENKVQDIADRQLRNEQKYFDCLNHIFTRLEELGAQNVTLSSRNQVLVDREQTFIDRINDLQEHLARYRDENASLRQEIGKYSNDLQEHLARYRDENASLRQEISKYSKEIKSRDIGIEQLQEELSHQSLILINAQAELAFLYSRQPKARIKRLLKRFGYFVTPLLPISLLRRGKRSIRNMFGGRL
jgi:predicted  nucleic acid-binding Zn-ribbon protein